MFDDLASFHPQIVHFPIALTFVGVGARLLWGNLQERLVSHAATALLLCAALGAIAAVYTGDQAHGPVERVPGSRDAVVEHEEWGERSRNLLIAIALVELGALFVRGNAQRGIRYVSAVAGLAAMYFMYETGEHGGELVYSYAGGVGIRTGDSADVQRLLLAGLYHQAQRDRAAGRAQDAANLVGEMGRRFPNDTGTSARHRVTATRHATSGRSAGGVGLGGPASDQPRTVSQCRHPPGRRSGRHRAAGQCPGVALRADGDLPYVHPPARQARLLALS